MQPVTFILCADGHATEDTTGAGKCSHAGCEAAVQAVFNVAVGMPRPAGQ